MCGIVGYFGKEDPKKFILEGLKSLEYRGYDSSGVSILDEGKFKRFRAAGKLHNLEERILGENFDGQLGIGHTRWATHGAPSEKNAHPHIVNGVSIVHNGIIENYLYIKDELKEKGKVLSSDTDSEMIAHLIDIEMGGGCNLLEAVENIIPRLEGAYAVLAVSESEPNTIVGFKKGPPLILGISEEAMYLASDIQAIRAQTDRIIYLEDDEVLEVTNNKYRVFDSNFEEVKRDETVIDWTHELAEKCGYKHFMLKEIFEQPRSVAAAIAPHIDLDKKSVEMSFVGETEKLNEVERIFIVACGTSFYAGMVGEYLFEKLAKIPVEIELASEFRYREPIIPKKSLVIIVSQSGETADSLAVLRQVKDLGALTMSICNVQASTIDREAEINVYMNAGVEIGVASTKAYTATLAVFNLLSLYMAKVKKQVNEEDERKYIDQLLAVPSQMELVLSYDKFFAKAAKTLKLYNGFLYLGRGVNYPIALEGALKLKELAYMHAEGYAAGEMKHGPLALVDEKMAVVVIAPKDDVYEKTISNLQEAKARGGQIISIGTIGDKKLEELSLHLLGLPESIWTCNSILSVIPVQLLSYHVAVALGNDVDQPRNLAKSVTVE